MVLSPSALIYCLFSLFLSSLDCFFTVFSLFVFTVSKAYYGSYYVIMDLIRSCFISGIWRPVRLVVGQELHVRSLRTRTTKVGEGWQGEGVLDVRSFVKLWSNPRVHVNITQGSRLVRYGALNTTYHPTPGGVTIKLSFSLFDPRDIFLWSPLGHGAQHLYQLAARVCTRAECQTATANFGFRTVKLDQSPVGSRGKKFEFVVNERPVYIKGANLVPLSVFGPSGYNLTTLFDLIQNAGIHTLEIRAVLYINYHNNQPAFSNLRI